jgi:CRP/FNR family cyclic AMP-dependent transcriptional regulator
MACVLLHSTDEDVGLSLSVVAGVDPRDGATRGAKQMIHSTVHSSPFGSGNLTVDRLRRVSIFSHLNDVELAGLARRTSLKRWHADAIVLTEHDRPSGLYIVARGRAKTVLFGESGREITLGVLQPGDFFGETALLDSDHLEANLVAVDDLALLCLERDAFLQLVARDRQVSLALLARMARRVRRSDALAGDLALRDVGARLRRTLLALAEERGEARGDGIYIRRRPTQQDLANMVGTCRETVSRLLSAMGRSGLIEARGRSLLLRPPLLERRQMAC